MGSLPSEKLALFCLNNRAPVPENFKAWRLIIIRDEESKKFLQDCVKYKANDPWTYKYPELQFGRLSHIPKEDRVAEMEKMFDRGFGDWFTQADVLILVVSGYVSWRDQPNASMSPGQAPMYCIACGNCTQNMMIAATALGLGLNYDPLMGGDGSLSIVRETSHDLPGRVNAKPLSSL